MKYIHDENGRLLAAFADELEDDIRNLPPYRPITPKAIQELRSSGADKQIVDRTIAFLKSQKKWHLR